MKVWPDKQCESPSMVKKVFIRSGVRHQVLACEWCEVLPQRERAHCGHTELENNWKSVYVGKSTMKGQQDLKMVRKGSLRESTLAKLFRV